MIKRKINSKIAELVGILLGDGYIDRKSKRIKISFNSRDDKEYLFYVKQLIREIFDIDPIIKFRTNENTAELFIFNKKITEFLTQKIGLKFSPKWSNAVIPKEFTSKNLSRHVIRGYFDTDGCLVTTNNNGTIYPRLEMKICPSPMQNQFIDILNKYDFKFGIYQIGRGKVRIQLNGKNQLKKWIKLIYFSNQKHMDKIKRFI
tara:strand:- start:2731 stop:3339 length:609 start_codon:yes stop_codon:yes gene_type:complete